MGELRVGRTLVRYEAIVLYVVAAVLCLPVLSFIVSAEALWFDRVLGMVAPLLLAVGVIGVHVWWERNDWELGDVSVQFFWFLLGAISLGSAAVLFGLYVEAHGGTLVHPWFIVGNWTVGGGLIGLVLGLYDGERRQALNQSERAQKAAERHSEQVEVLNRVLRHDIRNGVNIIQGHADLVESTVDDERVEWSAMTIGSTAAGLYEIAEHARQLENTLDCPEQAVNVSTLLQTNVDQIQASCPNASINCHYETSATVAGVGRLDIAFEQVLHNAVDHHPDTPHVNVSVKDGSADTVKICVTDDGDGLPTSELKVFENREETQLQHSQGIGLWLARWAVEASGGEMDVESSMKGTVVRITLPRV